MYIANCKELLKDSEDLRRPRKKERYNIFMDKKTQYFLNVRYPPIDLKSQSNPTQNLGSFFSYKLTVPKLTWK